MQAYDQATTIHSLAWYIAFDDGEKSIWSLVGEWYVNIRDMVALNRKHAYYMDCNHDVAREGASRERPPDKGRPYLETMSCISNASWRDCG